LTQEKRRFARTRHRVGCEFELANRRHTGIVGDISARGLFVQSSVLPPRGTELELVLRVAGSAAITVSGCVARLSRPNRTAAAVVPVGFAVQITWAPEAYFALLLELGSA
jgi:hypothetical protein